jgi:glucokinase
MQVVLMNDFVANGYGLLTLNHSDANDVLVLQDVPPIFGAPLACIGAGTGLGECFVTSPNRHGVPDYTAYPSEGVKNAVHIHMDLYV